LLNDASAETLARYFHLLPSVPVVGEGGEGAPSRVLIHNL
jgi:hypothetical protein